MGVSRSLVLAAAAAAALALAGVPMAAASKKGLFGRMAQEAGSGEALREAAATATGALDGGALGQALESLQDKQWAMAERAFGGDMLGVMRDSMLTNKQHLEELSEAWGNKKIFDYLYDNTPFFKAIKPLRALKEAADGGALQQLGEKAATVMEGQTGWNREQGREAVKAFADVMLKMFDAIEGVRDPQRMAQKLADYANGKDKLFNDLKARVESGDKSAEFEMQQHMLNNELGELVDLKELGFDGTEPAIFQLAREAVKKEEPAIWDSVLSSPLARKYMDDPMAAVREVQAVTNEYAAYWDKNKPLNP